jgi:hypothetical protein
VKPRDPRVSVDRGKYRRCAHSATFTKPIMTGEFAAAPLCNGNGGTTLTFNGAAYGSIELTSV